MPESNKNEKPAAEAGQKTIQKANAVENSVMETITGELRQAIKINFASGGTNPEGAASRGNNGRRNNRNEPPRQVMSLRHVPGNQRGSGRNFRFDYADPEVPRIRPQQRRNSTDFSRAYLKQDFFVYSDTAQTFFERNYEPVDRALIVASTIYTRAGGRQAGEQAEARMHELFTKVQKTLQAAIDNTKQILKENGASDSDTADYDHKRFYTPPVHSPLAMRFLSVVNLFDRLVARVESCWLNGIIDDHGRRSTLGHWNTEMTNAVRDIFRIRKEAWDLAAKTGNAQMARAIEQKVARENEQEKGLVGKDIPVAAKKPEANAAENPAEARARRMAARRASAAARKEEAKPTAPAATETPAEEPPKVEAEAAPAPAAEEAAPATVAPEAPSATPAETPVALATDTPLETPAA